MKKGFMPHFKPSIHFTPLEGNAIALGEKSIAVKLQHAADGKAIPNPITEYMALFYQGTVEQFFK
jgi:hypothetical protein